MTTCTCGEPIVAEHAFCLRCGKLTRALPEVGDGAVAEYEAQVQRLVGCIHADFEQSREPLWDALVARYVGTVGTVKQFIQAIGGALSTETEAVSFDAITGKIDQFVAMCRRQDFEVALVGAVKAGKSTLINALFEKELASTSVVPETAALTKFRSVAKNYVKVSFYSADEWERLWKTVPKETDAKGEYLAIFMSKYKALNAEAQRFKFVDAAPVLVYCEQEADLKVEIEKWTSARQPSHYFVKEVEVGLSDFELPPNVVLVDTPGLNDPVTYRSDITKSYIDSANAVLVCVKAAVLTEPELQTIRGVFANTDRRDKIYVIGTQLDLLNAPARHNWSLQRNEWVQHLRLPQCFNSIELADRNVIGSAAYLYTLGLKRKKGIPLAKTEAVNERAILRSGGEKFGLDEMEEIDAKIHELLLLTGIPSLKERLQKEVIQKSKDLLAQEIDYRYRSRREDIDRLLRNVRRQQSQMLQRYDQAIEIVEQDKIVAVQKLETIEATKAGLEELLETLTRQTKHGAAELTDKIDQMKRA